MFNPSRLELARRRRGITKRALAEATGISVRSLAGYHRAEREPDASVVEKLATTLQFPSAFFYGDTLDEPPSDGASFRALVRLTARLKHQAIAAGAIGISLSDWIDERFKLPSVDIPRYRNIDPETAAIEIRNRWAIGERPIKNMIHLLELHGVRVFSLVEQSVDLDACSFWRGDIPYVFLNTMKSAERSRMDAAHELGHLVLHSNVSKSNTKVTEAEAQRFAGAFLMPSGSLISNVRRGASLGEIIKAKRLWIVSAAALTYRMHKVGLLSDWEFRLRFAEIGRHNYLVNEPNPAIQETSQILDKVFRLLLQEGISLNQMAVMLSIYPDELSKLLFRLIRAPIPVPLAAR